jgi:ankyrin repeat protein
MRTGVAFLALLAGVMCSCNRTQSSGVAAAPGGDKPDAKRTESPPSPSEAAPKPATDPAYAARLARLHAAIEKGQVSTVIQALKEGGDIDDKDDQGETCLMKACAKGHLGIVRILLLRGAEVDEQDNKGRTALMHAAENGNELVIEILLKPEEKVARSADALNVLVKDTGAALPEGLKLSVPTKIKAASPGLDDKEGKSALMHALANGHLRAALAITPYREGRSAYMSDTDRRGRTGFMHAVFGGHAECVKYMLLTREGDFYTGYWDDFATRTDRDGKTALDLAREKGHKDVVKLLEKFQNDFPTDPRSKKKD